MPADKSPCISNPIPASLIDFSPAQQSAILDPAPIKQIIAAAGSGKTRTILGLTEHALRSGAEKPGRILLLTFSRKATAAMKARLAPEFKEGTEISTFHSFCFRHLRRLHPEFSRTGMTFMDPEVKKNFYYRALRKEGLELPGIPFDLLLQNPHLFRRYFPESSMRVHRSYYSWKRESGFLEYEDLITCMLDDLRAKKTYLNGLRKQYDLILVDEFQDTDPRQLHFLQEMNPPRLVVVGDAAQAIYSFRGADPEIFSDFRRYFPGATRFHLSENYRSLSPVVRTGNRILKQCSDKLYRPVRSMRGKGPGFPCIGTALRAGEESEMAARLSNYPDCVLLVRSNYRARIWQAAGLEPERIMTIHKAKGLEFPVVCLDLIGGWSGFSTGIDSEKERKKRFREEMRTAYVGASRAENLLITVFDPSAGLSPERTLGEKLFRTYRRDLSPEKTEEYLEREREYRG